MKNSKKLFKVTPSTQDTSNTPKGQTTTTIQSLPSIPELHLGDHLQFIKEKSKKDCSGIIKRFFHHNKLNRNEVVIQGDDGKRHYILESDLNPEILKELDAPAEVNKKETSK